jgi:hypothetical protein
MQQFSQAVQSVVSVSGNRLPLPSSQGAFVVNLGSSSTPVALNGPRQPELKAFTFFISRRREDGRERFRLHMGYFATQQDAEAMLELVRDIYPGAWAGVAPGRKPPQPVPVPTTEINTVPTTPLPAATARAAAPPPVPAPSMTAAANATELKLEIEPAPPLPDEHFAATQSLHSVRAAIASLDDSSRQTALSSTATLKLLEAPPESAPSPPAIIPTLPPAGRTPPAATPSAGASTDADRAPSPTLSPEAIAAYAVQLRWATQPIGVSELPPLAIFDAYTLYRAKGRQEGAYWHALRLGFFTDLVSAEQVASYIRPEFAEATVVPVGAAERGKALSAAGARPASSAAQTPAPSPAKAAPGTRPASGAAPAVVDTTGQFKLIEDTGAKPLEHSKFEMMLTSDAAPGAKPSPAAGKSAPKMRRPPASLEETLDVLGAGSLKLDGAKGEMLDASGVRRMRHAAERKPPARSSLSKLFDRLSEHIGGGR